MHGIGMVEAERRVQGKVKRERRYYLTSLVDATTFGRAVQERELSGQVGIENRLHWVPDIAFWEDESWARGGGERYLLTVIAG